MFRISVEDDAPELSFSDVIKNDYGNRGLVKTKDGSRFVVNVKDLVLSTQYDKEGKLSTRVTSSDLDNKFFVNKVKNTKKVFVLKKYVTKKSDDEFAAVEWIIKNGCAAYKGPKQSKDDKVMDLDEGFELGNVRPAGDEEKKWLEVEILGENGFLDNLYEKVYDLVYENRVRFGIPNKTRDDIAKMMPVKIWHPTLKDSVELDSSKSSSLYIPLKHFKPNDKYPNPVFAEFTVPGSNTNLTIDQVINNVITINGCISVDSVFFGAKMSLQMKIISGIVTDINSKGGRSHIQQDELEEFGLDTALVEKLQKQMAALKTSPGPMSSTEDPNLMSQVMSDGPVSGSADLGISELIN